MGWLLGALSAPFVLRRLRKARELLQNETPLKLDCGRLCGGACCQPDEGGENGMLLYPFEERLYRKPIEGFAFRLIDDDTLYKGGKRLVCEGACPREHRPLACRVFPLRMKLECDPDGSHTRVVAELDPRARAVCPLPKEGGMRAMRPEFAQAVTDAGNALVGSVYMLEALENEQRLVDEWLRF